MLGHLFILDELKPPLTRGRAFRGGCWERGAGGHGSGKGTTRMDRELVGDRCGGRQRSQVGGQGTRDESSASDINQAWKWTLNMTYCGYLYFVSEVHHLERNSYIMLLWKKTYVVYFKMPILTDMVLASLGIFFTYSIRHLKNLFLTSGCLLWAGCWVSWPDETQKPGVSNGVLVWKG